MFPRPKNKTVLGNQSAWALLHTEQNGAVRWVFHCFFLNSSLQNVQNALCQSTGTIFLLVFCYIVFLLSFPLLILTQLWVTPANSTPSGLIFLSLWSEALSLHRSLEQKCFVSFDIPGELSYLKGHGKLLSKLLKGPAFSQIYVSHQSQMKFFFCPLYKVGSEK